mmetsp:Transcript_82637/g.130706  ORF Transcript_82637/g.130706 Transcript_82637/m.130706 type:complete len:222 (+) Transcript_82637:640-1305(+)
MVEGCCSKDVRRSIAESTDVDKMLMHSTAPAEEISSLDVEDGNRRGDARSKQKVVGAVHTQRGQFRELLPDAAGPSQGRALPGVWKVPEKLDSPRACSATDSDVSASQPTQGQESATIDLSGGSLRCCRFRTALDQNLGTAVLVSNQQHVWLLWMKLKLPAFLCARDEKRWEVRHNPLIRRSLYLDFPVRLAGALPAHEALCGNRRKRRGTTPWLALQVHQ